MVLRKKYISGMSDMSLTKKEVMSSKDLLDRGNCVLLPEIEKIDDENRKRISGNIFLTKSACNFANCRLYCFDQSAF